MAYILSTEETIKHVFLGIPKGMKNTISISIAFSVDILIRSENIIYRYQFVGEDMAYILSTEETIKHVFLGIPKGMKNTISISIAFSVDILIRSENIISDSDTFSTIGLTTQVWGLVTLQARLFRIYFRSHLLALLW